MDITCHSLPGSNDVIYDLTIAAVQEQRSLITDNRACSMVYFQSMHTTEKFSYE